MKYDLVKSGMMSEEMSSFLQVSLKEGTAVIVSGSASSGKSMFVSYLKQTLECSMSTALLTVDERVLQDDTTAHKVPTCTGELGEFINHFEVSKVELLALDYPLPSVISKVPFLKLNNKNVIAIMESNSTYNADKALDGMYKNIGLRSIQKEDDFRIIVQLGVSVEGRRIVKEISERIPLDTKGSYIVPLFGYNDESKCFKQLKYTGDGRSMLSKSKEGARFIYE